MRAEIPPGGCGGGGLCLLYPHPTFLPAPQRMFAPALPSDLLVNVYINLNKLCLTVYQLHTLQPNSTKPQGPDASGALLPRTSAQLEALCSTAPGPCCKYTVGRDALESPLHLRSWGA